MGIEEAVAKHQKLSYERDDPGYWGQNIIDSYQLLETKRDITLFYAVTADGGDFDRNKK